MMRLVCLWLGLLFSLPLQAELAVPAPEKLLPEDTLVMITAPDFGKVCRLYNRLPQSQFWNDPAMKPFKERFVSHWKEEFVQPLERELALKFADYTGLLQGQLTLAMTQNGWQGKDDGASPGLLLLADAKDKQGQLRTDLAELRKKWVDAGKTLQTEKLHGFEFSVLSLSSNDVPRTLRRFFPPSPQVQEWRTDEPTNKVEPKTQLVIGQAGSLLILGNSLKAVERVVIRLTGGSLPALGDLASYQANHLALFRDAPLFGWINTKALLDIWTHRLQKPQNPQAPNPFDPRWDRLLPASGLTGLNTIAAGLRDTPQGELFQLFLGVPEAQRAGVFKILAGESKETSPPPFVPGDAVKFRRWRIDGQKAWATLVKMLRAYSPQAAGVINFILDSADANEKLKDPGFDIRRNLIGNLGDDIITYEKAPRSSTQADLDSPPSIFLLGSPRAQQLAASLRSVLVFTSPQANTAPEEREFLGRKIFSVPLGPMPLQMGHASRVVRVRTLYYSASGGYVALSTDVSMLEEYLRSSEAQGKTLRETAGLAEAAQEVLGPGTSLFGYENQAETLRASFEAARTGAGSATNAPSPSLIASLLPSGLSLPGTREQFKSWMDFSLLPPFDKVSKYFHFTVYGGSATVDGLTFKWFAPVPPGLRGSKAPK